MKGKQNNVGTKSSKGIKHQHREQELFSQDLKGITKSMELFK